MWDGYGMGVWWIGVGSMDVCDGWMCDGCGIDGCEIDVGWKEKIINACGLDGVGWMYMHSCLYVCIYIGMYVRLYEWMWNGWMSDG